MKKNSLLAIVLIVLPPKTDENPRPRPKIIPNTFTVYEFGN